MYYVFTKDGAVHEAKSKSAFVDVMKEIEPDDVEKIVSGQEMSFRFAEVPVVEPKVKRPRKSKAD